MSNDVKFSIKKDGVNLKIKRDLPDIILTPKAICESVGAIRAAVAEDKQKLINIDIQKVQTIESLEEAKKKLADIEKHYESAHNIQLALAKKLMNDVGILTEQEIRDQYKYDDGLTDKGNDCQRFAQYQRAMATNPVIATALCADVIKEFFYNNEDFINPFKPKS